jgi:hypothetical protein
MDAMNLTDKLPKTKRLQDVIKVPERPKLVEVMTMPELLRIAERMTVEQSNVKKMFESGRLNEEGLRRVTRAYLRGERYDKVMTENLISPAQNYEVDPYAKRASGSTQEAVMADGSSTTNHQVHNDPVQPSGTNNNTPRISAPKALKTAMFKPLERGNPIMVSAVVIVAIIVLAYFMLR